VSRKIGFASRIISADVSAYSNVVDGVQGTVQEFNAKSLRISSSLVGAMNTELADLKSRSYIVVNN
jgi:hypothetical protein